MNKGDTIIRDGPLRPAAFLPNPHTTDSEKPIGVYLHDHISATKGRVLLTQIHCLALVLFIASSQ